uniref:Uncharacterized protein n=1 Tax=Mus spicilegus TaxID=10103 RepID=A0A8C6N4D1_MUSSI
LFFFFVTSWTTIIQTLFYCFERLQYMAILHFSVTLLKAFELGSALLWCPEKATFSKLFSHDSIQFALPMAGLKCFIKSGLLKDIKKSLGFFIAPMHTCHSRIKFKNIKKAVWNFSITHIL